ncbi:WcaA Glycosyltransferases involved in cell wall biogenesis [Candidatus Methylopumilus universalis]|uniref:glycosyltransferase family 2 protein n=1 Tax=Candidatus Methylopumilus universalis TaxID=2588536 RepID=UPI003BEEE44A
MRLKNTILLKPLITISIIIPVFNEEKTIKQILLSVKASKVKLYDFEIIVVEDGSTDKTLDILLSNPSLYSKLIQQKRNQGKGAAIREGILQASGDYILFQDADLEYDPKDFQKLLLMVTKFDADLIIGSRFIAPEFTRVYYFWHKIGNKVITLLFNIINNTTFTDIYSCYLLFKKDLLDINDLKSNGWEQQAEILSLLVSLNIKMFEVPISYSGRTYGEGKKIRAHHIIAVIWMIIKKFFIIRVKR